MLQINGKTFMNLQEAVQWLLDNNALPFQSSANYVANTEIGMGTIVNPSPAKVRIGSLIFFADSKVSTVTGLTENGFIVSDQYNDLVDDVVYVSNVELDASGHLIVTLSNGNTIDAGLIKQVSEFSIDGSQHLIASYNDGSTTDLGAIFSGNVNIAGNLTADSIIENMSGYSYNAVASSGTRDVENIYAGIVKNGNKLTMAVALNVTVLSGNTIDLYPSFTLPASIASKLYPTRIKGFDALAVVDVLLQPTESGSSISGTGLIYKSSNTVYLNISCNTLVTNTKYYLRVEQTFLLSQNLAS